MTKSIIAIALIVCFSSAAEAQRELIIVNGVRMEKCEGALSSTNPIADLDPNAIDNIEVVKGAAAIKQYGAEAVNGVIVATTKKGAIVSPTACGASKSQDGASQDPIAKFLYAPEVVMAHQEAIGLTDRQRTAIQDAVKELQSKVFDTQLKLGSSGEKLGRSLAATSVDEAAVLQQIDQVLAFEREIKRAQVTLLVRIKNQLTAAQQGMLDKLR